MRKVVGKGRSEVGVEKGEVEGKMQNRKKNI